MDANKLERLRQRQYLIGPACGLCVHARIERGKDWGTCKSSAYLHEKHTGEPREMSIHRVGSCVTFEASPEAIAEIEHFRPVFSRGAWAQPAKGGA